MNVSGPSPSSEPRATIRCVRRQSEGHLDGVQRRRARRAERCAAIVGEAEDESGCPDSRSWRGTAGAARFRARACRGRRWRPARLQRRCRPGSSSRACRSPATPGRRRRSAGRRHDRCDPECGGDVGRENEEIAAGIDPRLDGLAVQVSSTTEGSCQSVSLVKGIATFDAPFQSMR